MNRLRKVGRAGGRGVPVRATRYWPVGFVARLAGRLAGGAVGVFAGWMAALYPAHVLITSQPISVGLLACLLMGTLLAAFRLQEVPSSSRALAVGGVIGLYGLGRSQALLLIPVPTC